MKTIVKPECPLSNQNTTTDTDLLPNIQNIHVIQAKKIMLMVQDIFSLWGVAPSKHIFLNAY